MIFWMSEISIEDMGEGESLRLRIGSKNVQFYLAK